MPYHAGPYAAGGGGVRDLPARHRLLRPIRPRLPSHYHLRPCLRVRLLPSPATEAGGGGRARPCCSAPGAPVGRVHPPKDAQGLTEAHAP
jgi:hypothetical protein